MKHWTPLATIQPRKFFFAFKSMSFINLSNDIITDIEARYYDHLNANSNLKFHFVSGRGKKYECDEIQCDPAHFSRAILLTKSHLPYFLKGKNEIQPQVKCARPHTKSSGWKKSACNCFKHGTIIGLIHPMGEGGT